MAGGTAGMTSRLGPFDEHAGELPRGTLPPEQSTIRVRELSAVHSFATTAHEASLLIVGAPGSGKTRLLKAVEDAAGLPTYRVRVNPAEVDLPLSGLSAVLASFHDPAAAGRSSTLLAAPEQHGALTSRAAELLSFVRSLSHPASLLLIDDIDRMDTASQTVLGMTAARLGGTGLRLAATASSAPSDGPLAALPRVKIAPLSFAESLALVSEVTTGRSTEAVRRLLVSAVGGNPRALTGAARALTAEQLAGMAPLSLPFRAAPHGAAAVLADAAERSPDRRRLMERLASASLSSRASIQESPDVTALDELLSSGIAVSDGRYVQLSDPLLRSELYWSLDAATRLDLHTAAAQEEREYEPGLASWHTSWVAATPPPATELLEAATQFTEIGRVWQAVELAERGLAIGRDPAHAASALYDLSYAMFLQGELAYADRYARLAQRVAGNDGIASRLATLRTRIEFMSSHELRTADADDWVNIDDSRSADDAAQMLSVIALHHAERWEVDAARESLERAAVLLPEASADTNEMYTLAAMLLAAVEGNREPTDTMFRHVSHSGFAQIPPMKLLVLGRCLTLLDLHTAARRIFRTVLGLEPAPAPIWLETARYFHAENEVLAGNQFEAVSIIAELQDAQPETQVHRARHKLLMVWYWQALGNPEAAEAAAAECRKSFASGANPALAARLAALQGSFAITQGRYEDAIAILRSVGATGHEWANPNLLRCEADLIEACVLAGRLDEAVTEFRDFHARSMPYRTRWTMLAIARANALVTPGDASIKSFQQAVRLWHPGDSPFELGRTLLSYADRLAALGRAQESREQYLAAQMVFAQLGAKPWLRRTDGLRAEAAGQTAEHPLLQALAPDERLVVDMVRQGLHNKEIAARLFVSLRTVEVRLTRVYHKLGARSRAHLTAMLSNGDGGPARGVPDWSDTSPFHLEATDEGGIQR